MKARRKQAMNIVSVVVGVATVGALVVPAHGGAMPPPTAVSAPTTVPIVAPVSVDLQEDLAKPPAIGPIPRPIPAARSALTYVGELPADLIVPPPALRVSGNGELEIHGTAAVRFSGNGTLWIDKVSSVTLAPDTTGTKTALNDGWNYEGFSGTAWIVGTSLRLRAKGKRLFIVVDGRGTVTLRGGEGTFRLTQAGRREVSGIWDESGVTQEFEKIETEATTETVKRTKDNRYGLAVFGLLPATRPPVKVYPVPLLPSERRTAPATSVATTPTTPTTTPAAPKP